MHPRQIAPLTQPPAANVPPLCPHVGRVRTMAFSYRCVVSSTRPGGESADGWRAPGDPASVGDGFSGDSRRSIHDDTEQLPPDSVLGKVGLILRVFDADNATLGISEIARQTGIPKATVFRLCRDMATLGFLDRHWSEFRLGMRLFELGALVQRQRLLHELAMPFLQDLRVATNETVHLGIPRDGEVFYVARLAGHQSHVAPSRIAGRAPMYCTATGKAILAHLPAPLVDDFLSRPMVPHTRSTIVAPNVLREQLVRIRESGVAYEHGEISDEFCSVAAPVFGPGRRLLGAVSVTGPTSRLSIDAATPRVRAAGSKISDRASSYWDLV